MAREQPIGGFTRSARSAEDHSIVSPENLKP